MRGGVIRKGGRPDGFQGPENRNFTPKHSSHWPIVQGGAARESRPSGSKIRHNALRWKWHYVYFRSCRNNSHVTTHQPTTSTPSMPRHVHVALAHSHGGDHFRPCLSLPTLVLISSLRHVRCIIPPGRWMIRSSEVLHRLWPARHATTHQARLRLLQAAQSQVRWRPTPVLQLPVPRCRMLL